MNEKNERDKSRLTSELSTSIPYKFIDNLMKRIDIVDVIKHRLVLTKAGGEYKAHCPFCLEKTQSFAVSPAKQFYHCFSCGAHGTAAGFLMEYEEKEFTDAIEELARMAGVEVPREPNGTVH